MCWEHVEICCTGPSQAFLGFPPTLGLGSSFISILISLEKNTARIYMQDNRKKWIWQWLKGKCLQLGGSKLVPRAVLALSKWRFSPTLRFYNFLMKRVTAFIFKDCIVHMQNIATVKYKTYSSKIQSFIGSWICLFC